MAGRNTVEILINMKKQGTGARDASKEMDGLQTAVKTAGAAMLAFAATQVTKAAYELAELGAASLRTKNAFEAISGSSVEAEARLDAMARATRGALSEMDMMASANRLMQMGLANNAEELENVATMAVRLGTAMGRDAKQSLEEFALLLANQSIPRLDTFGISAGRVRTRIKELQAATPGLTREMAFMQATMEQGTLAMDRLGVATDDEKLAFERLEATMTDLKVMVGEMLAPALSELVSIIADGLEYVKDSQEEHAALVEMFGEEAVAAQEVNEQMDYLIAASAALNPELEVTAEATERTGMSMQDMAFWMERGAAQTEYARRAMEGVAQAAPITEEAVWGLGEAADNLGKKFAQGIPDAEDMFMMMLGTGRVAGMSATEIGDLAEAMGVADSATVNAVIEAERLITAFDEGKVTMEDMVRHAGLLEEANENLTLAEEAEREGNLELAAQYRNTASELLKQAGRVRDLRAEYRYLIEMGPAIQGFLSGAAIPPMPTMPALPSLYGGGGQQVAGATYNRNLNMGGNTYIVQDTASLAAIEEASYNNSMRNFERSFQ